VKVKAPGPHLHAPARRWCHGRGRPPPAGRQLALG